MTQEVVGLKFLKENEILNMGCNMEEPFGFISYSHDLHDSQIVMNVFKALYEKGFNLWIDTANMPYNEEDWQMSALSAMMNKKCKYALFFRSESSMIKSTIKQELEYIKNLKHIGPIVTIDIWQNLGNTAEKYKMEILNNGDPEIFKTCEEICKVVSTQNKAIRLASDAGNDIEKLVSQIENILNKNEIYPEQKTRGAEIKEDFPPEKTPSLTLLEPANTGKGISDPIPLSGAPKRTVGRSLKNEGVIPLIDSWEQISEDITLGGFAEMCQDREFCLYLRYIRALKGKEYNKQQFDYVIAALLRGCDEKLTADSPKWNYCTYAVAARVEMDNPSLGASQFTWKSNCAKFSGKDKNGDLGENNNTFAKLSKDITIKQLREMFRTQAGEAFATKNNAGVDAVFAEILK